MEELVAVRANQLAAIAEFNRVYGALLRDMQRATLQSTTTSAATRVLLALGRRERSSSRQLCDDLAMDPAQLSRLVWRLTDEGYVVSLPSTGDRRVGALVLTQSGDAAFATLEAEQAEALLELVQHLTTAEVDRLVIAMATVQDLLSQS